MALLLTLGALAGLGATSLLALLLGARERAALAVGSAGCVLSCGVGLAGSLLAVLGGFAGSGPASATSPARGIATTARWPLPLGTLEVGVDALSAYFLLCVFLVSGLAAIYGAGYLKSSLGRGRVGGALALFNLLVAAMVGVVVARDVVVLLAAWEVMTVASFFLVTLESEREETRRAGVVYLIASQLGVVPLFLFFTLLARHAGGTGFAALEAAGPVAGSGLLFVLALVGFGAKAGFWPLHVWLPDAHPAAPTNVSALMSGVMIKLGIYGLLRALILLGPPPAWWGVTLVVIGIVSGMGGVFHALAQHDLKRLLAYHSVENIGIIALGLGVGLLGQSYHAPAMACLGFSGALLHVLNHGLFKGLLFQGAGAVLHATGTRDLDSLGGLYRRMPTTGLGFLVGSAAISGLPPLNGFVSELLIYAGAFVGAANLPVAGAAWAIAVVPALAAIGGLASACFVKAFGVVFLGEPRTQAAERAHEVGPAMRVAMVAGALCCLVIGAWPAGALRLVARASEALTGVGEPPALVAQLLAAVSQVALLLAGAVLALVLARRLLLRGRDVRRGPTWGCGYEAPTARMQYTAASFAEPVLAPSLPVLDRRVHQDGPRGYFPTSARREEHLGDLAADRVFVPATSRLVALLERARVLQQGRVGRLLIYVLVTLVALLAWQLAT